LVAATKKLFVVPNFVAVTKPFFSVSRGVTGTFAESTVCTAKMAFETFLIESAGVLCVPSQMRAASPPASFAP